MSSQSHRMTKIITTETSHRLMNHNGGCRNIHGHSYKWEVTLRGAKKCDTDGDPESGMIMDFKQVKDLLKLIIINSFDHKLVLYEQDPLIGILTNLDIAVEVFPATPTAENFAAHVGCLLRASFNDAGGFYPTIQIDSVRVWETATSYAEWRNES